MYTLEDLSNKTQLTLYINDLKKQIDEYKLLDKGMIDEFPVISETISSTLLDKAYLDDFEKYNKKLLLEVASKINTLRHICCLKHNRFLDTNTHSSLYHVRCDINKDAVEGSQKYIYVRYKCNDKNEPILTAYLKKACENNKLLTIFENINLVEIFSKPFTLQKDAYFILLTIIESLNIILTSEIVRMSKSDCDIVNSNLYKLNALKVMYFVFSLKKYLINKCLDDGKVLKKEI